MQDEVVDDEYVDENPINFEEDEAYVEKEKADNEIVIGGLGNERILAMSPSHAVDFQIHYEEARAIAGHH